MRIHHVVNFSEMGGTETEDISNMLADLAVQHPVFVMLNFVMSIFRHSQHLIEKKLRVTTDYFPFKEKYCLSLN